MNKYQVIFYDMDENNEYFSVFVKAQNDSFALPIAFHKLDKSGNSYSRAWDEIRVILVKEGR